MKSFLFLTVFLFCSCMYVRAQTPVISNADSLKKYLQQNNFSIDSNAAAIILYEYSKIEIESNRIFQTIERVVKILKQESTDKLGAIAISTPFGTKIRDIEASCFNWEQDIIVRQEVNEKDIINDAVQTNYAVTKFNFPSVKPGSVIHYRYTIVNLGTTPEVEWVFQDEFPTLESYFELSRPFPSLPSETVSNLSIPAYLTEKKSDLDSCLSCHFKEINKKSPRAKINEIWVRRNIPAFKQEALMGNPIKQIERIRIYQTQFLKDWDYVIKRNFYNGRFKGKQVFSSNKYLVKTIEEIGKDKSNDLEKALALYAFVRDSIKEDTHVYSDNSIRFAFRNRSGSNWEKSLLLTAMLRQAGWDAVPLIITPKYAEPLSPHYPKLDGPFAAICKLNLDNKDYFLYPTPKLPFGILPANLYNGYARTVERQSREIILIPDSITNKTSVLVSAEPLPEERNTVHLNIDIQFGLFSSYRNRLIWEKDTSLIKEVANRILDLSDMKPDLLSYRPVNLENADTLLGLHIEAEMTLQTGANYINPFLYNFIDNNPLTDLERLYPVELDYLQDFDYQFQLTYPEGYAPDALPVPSNLIMGNNDIMEMKSDVQHAPEKQMLTFRNKLTIRKATFAAEEYKDLRTFLDKVIQEQNKRFILNVNQNKGI